MNNTISVKFWGVRGSYPVPGPSTLRYGGNTACVEVNAGGRSIILDAGTGLVPLGQDLMRRLSSDPQDIVLLLSHIHHDHIQGLPFFAPVHLASTRFRIYGMGESTAQFQADLNRTIAPPYFPVTLKDFKATTTMENLTEEVELLIPVHGGAPMLTPALQPGVEWNDPDVIRVRSFYTGVHPGGVLVFRIEWRGNAIVYATDIEGGDIPDPRLVKFVRNASLLIHDAQYTEQHYLGRAPGFPPTRGWGHSTWLMACDIASLAGVRYLALFHYEPRYSDETISRIAVEASQVFPGTMAAYENFQFMVDHRSLPKSVRPTAELNPRSGAQVYIPNYPASLGL